jgi:hypothetical protein
MRNVRVASVTLLAIAAIAAADPAVAVEAPKAAAAREYTTQASRTISLSNADAKQVAKAALFVTEDGGQTWRKDQELNVPENATVLPAFTFNAPKDGTFGLWTVATRRDGVSEPEPLAGAAPRLVIVVDRAPPTLTRLDATLGGVADGQATLAVSWQVSDPNPATDPVSLEVSLDQGKTFTAQHSGGVEGTTAVVVPVTGSPEVQVRVIARDLAGNVLTSPAKAVSLPVDAKPADPEAALAAAVAALPAPSDLGVAGRSGSPIITAGENPLATSEAAPAAGNTTTTVVTTTTTTTAPAATTQAGTQTSTETEIIANSDVETRYAQAAGAPVAQPRGRQSSSTDAADAPVRSDASRGVEADPSTPFLTGNAAMAALDQARRAESDGEINDALVQYLNLHRSSVAKEALVDELALLRRIGDYSTILGIVGHLPVELRTDNARLHAARASLKLDDASAAAAWAAKVRVNAPEAREALLVLGQSLKALGRDAEARRVFDKLAAGNDEIAAQARALK